MDNKKLIRSHIHSIVLQKIGMKLESGFGKILDIENEEKGFPTLSDFKKMLVAYIIVYRHQPINHNQQHASFNQSFSIHVVHLDGIRKDFRDSGLLLLSKKIWFWLSIEQVHNLKAEIYLLIYRKLSFEELLLWYKQDESQ